MEPPTWQYMCQTGAAEFPGRSCSEDRLEAIAGSQFRARARTQDGEVSRNPGRQDGHQCGSLSTGPDGSSATTATRPDRNRSGALRSDRPNGGSAGHTQASALVGRSRMLGRTTTTGRWFLSVRYPYPENRRLPPSPSIRRAPVAAIENLLTSAGQSPSPTTGDYLLHARRKDTVCRRPAMHDFGTVALARMGG